MADSEELDVDQSSVLILGSEIELPFRQSLIRSPTRVLELESADEESQLSARRLTLDVTPEGIATWRSQIAKASPAERELFLRYKAGDLQMYTAAIEKTVSDHGDDSVGLKVARGLNPIFKTMNLYAPIAQTMIQTDPTSSSLILGGITCIMAISARYLDYQEKISAMLSGMLKKLDILMKYGENIYRNNAQMQKAIMEVFGDVLDFCIQASRLFLDDKGKPRSGFRTFITSLGKSFESKFTDVLARFDADIKLFEEAADYVDRERQVAASKRMDMDRVVASQFMQYSVYETNQIHRGVVSIGQQMSVVEQSHREEAEKARIEEYLLIRGEKRRKIISWLPSIPFHKDQENTISKRLEGTGDWLVKNETFQNWKDSRISELLWIHGKHGCGKSYLAARVVRDLTEDIQRANKDKKAAKDIVAMAYIYCNSLEATKIDPSKLIGSLLNQLCHCLPKPEIDPSLESLYDRQTEAPTRQDMQRTIFSIMARFSRTYIIIDGLDECHTLEDGQFEDLCEFVNSLAQPKAMSSVAKVLALSRPEYPTIEDAFGECSKIQVDDGANTEDIKEFISKKASGKDLHLRYNTGLREEVEGTLLSRADGMFLWADLSVKALKGARSAKEIRKKLDELPRGLDERYEASMQRILNQGDDFVRTRALKILLWITNAKRPLSRNELKEALAIEPDMTRLDDESETKIHDDAGFAAECGDLIVLANGSYHLLHSSLKTYLEKLPTSKSDLLEEYGFMQKDAAIILGETCLTYLMLETFQTGPVDDEESLKKLHEENPLLQYAVNFWGRHVADTKGTDLLELTKKFLSLDGARELAMEVFWHQQDAAIFPYPGKTTPLHFLSIFNLVDVAQELTDVPSMRTNQDGLRLTPLDYAFVQESREMCIWILEVKDDVSPSTEPLHCICGPIHMSATHDWPDIIERLIELKYDPAAKFGNREQTPLNLAASEGSEAAMKALLKAKVNVNLSDMDGTTPLIDAADTNHPRLVKLLLEAGADVNVRGWNQITALHYAAQHGALGIAEALLEKGAEVDPVSGLGWSFRTPLHLAAEEGYLELVDLLIRKGADVNKSGPQGYTPLLLTCSAGFPACLERLLKAGAKIDGRNDTKQSCFHLSAMNGYTDVLEILVEKCQDRDLINSPDNKDDTPLHSAIWNGKTAQAKFLLEHGAVVDKLNNNQHSVLYSAILEDQLELAEVLVTQFKADTAQKGSTGSLALHYAANAGRHNFIPLILETGVDPNVVNDNVNTALHLAAKANSLEFIEKLIEAVPLLELAPKNSTNQTPLHMAASGGYTEIVAFFLGHTASSIQEKDDSKNLPVNSAAWNGHLEAIKLLINEENVNSRGYCGRTPIFGASSSGHTEIVEYLLKNGADPNLLDDYKQSPLFAALATKRSDVANILLAHGADPKIANEYGETALHRAAENGDVKMVKILLESGNDGLHTSAWNVTPFMRAVSSRSLEVVDAFLEYGFNGTAIPDKSGKTCIHVVAETGSVDMLKKLIVDNNEIALLRDCIDRDALDFAAAAGQVDMIEPLMELGLGLNGVENCSRKPIRTAASCGYLEFVSRLIDLGADVNMLSGNELLTPLHGATNSRRPLISERLLKAGADPTARNAFGLSALDMAFKDKLVWEKMGDARENYTPIELEKRMPSLRQIISKCVGIILALPEEQNPKTEFERLDCLESISTALYEIGTEESREYARLCYNELASPPDLANFCYTWTCDMCIQTPLQGKRYLCGTCAYKCLCNSCYSDYVKGGDTPNSVPKGLETLQKLENDLKPMRDIGKVFVLFGATYLYNCSDRVVAVVEWIDEKLKAYEEWEKTYNSSGRFDSYKRPGQMYLKLVEKSRKIFKDAEKDAAINVTEQITKIEEEIKELYREHKPDKEIPDFSCSEHVYIEIRDEANMDDSDKKCFGTDGKLKNEWLSDLLNLFQDVTVETRASAGVEPSLSNSESNPASGNTQGEESAQGDTMMLLTHVLTDEPAEIADTTDVSNPKNSEEHKSDPVISMLESSSKAKIEEAPRIAQSNALRLLTIRSELEKQMRAALADAEATREAALREIPKDSTQSPTSKAISSEDTKSINTSNAACAEDQIQDNQEQHISQVDQENRAKQDESNISHIDASNSKQKEPGEATEEDNMPRVILFLNLLEREIAWQFAQLVLLGAVEDSLAESIFGAGNTPLHEGEQAQTVAEDANGKLDNAGVDGGIHSPVEARETQDPEKGNDVGLLEKVPQPSEKGQEIETESCGAENKTAKEEEKKSEVNSGGDQLTQLRVGGKAVDKVVSELRRTSIDETIISHDRYKAIRQASIDSLPPSPLSRRSTDLFAKLI